MTNMLLLLVYICSVANLIPLSIAIFQRRRGLVYILAALEVVFAVLIALMANRGFF